MLEARKRREEKEGETEEKNMKIGGRKGGKEARREEKGKG